MTASNKENPPKKNPYHYQEYLFGRENDVRILINKIITHRLTLLFSPNGMGKTVFLKEAVIPELSSPTQKNLTVIYYDDWNSPPTEGLKSKIEAHIFDEEICSEKITQNLTDSSNLTDFFKFCALFVRHPLIIVLDQLEDLFQPHNKNSKKSIASFIEQLSLIFIDSSLPVKLLLSMREDSILELNAFTITLNQTKPNLALLLFDNYYRLQGITIKAAREAISFPAQQIGFYCEHELIDKIIIDLLNLKTKQAIINIDNECTGKIDPSYLQIICSQLWELEAETPDKTLHLSAYLEAGCLDGLLKRHAQSALETLSKGDQQVAAHLFKYLISRHGTRISHTLDGLVELLDIEEKKLHKVLANLVSQRILYYQQSGDKSWYTLFQDTLITNIREWETSYMQHHSNQTQSIHHESQED